MKRTPLSRKQPLRRVRLRARPKKPVDEPGRAEYKRVRHGICRVCGRSGLVRRHHVVYEQHVRREGGDPWDTRNALWVGLDVTCDCHERQHNASMRIPLEVLPEAALAFGVDLFGEARAAEYIARYYRADVSREVV